MALYKHRYPIDLQTLVQQIYDNLYTYNTAFYTSKLYCDVVAQLYNMKSIFNTVNYGNEH